jgi:hypothetical protein
MEKPTPNKSRDLRSLAKDKLADLLRLLTDDTTDDDQASSASPGHLDQDPDENPDPSSPKLANPQSPPESSEPV